MIEITIGAVICDGPCLVRSAGYVIGLAAYVALCYFGIRWVTGKVERNKTRRERDGKRKR